MCIIAVKPKGADMITEETIRTMFEKNAHGAGFMIQRDGEEIINIRKGFVTVQHLLAYLKDLEVKKDDIFVVHFRIATSGGIKKEMCHPFIVHRKSNKANAVSMATNLLCFAHNGIISDLNGRSKDFSDTSLFAMHYLSDRLIQDNLYESSVIQEMVEKFVDNSRLAFLHPKKGLLLLGTWHEDGGIHYSNTGYKKIVYTPPTYKWDADDDYRWGQGYGQNSSKETDDMYEKMFTDHGYYMKKKEVPIQAPIGFKTPEQLEEQQISKLAEQYNERIRKDNEKKDFPLSKMVEQKNDFHVHRRAPEYPVVDCCTYCGQYKQIHHEAKGDGFSSCLCKGCFDTLAGD